MGGQQQAASFSRPGVVAGAVERVSLDSRVGESVVVLVFYPSNFGPKAGQSAALLRAIDKLTTGTAAETLGISPESVYSHQRFGREADIHVPLVSDIDADIADRYDVATTGESGQPLAERSLFVLDYRGVVVHEWHAADAAGMPDFEGLSTRIDRITPDRSAQGSYRVGYARYREGRRHLSSGLEHCKSDNWGLAGSAFTEACGEFGQAAETFTTGQRLAEDETISGHNSRGRVTATTYWEAAEWLAGFATAARKGNAEERRECRDAAEAALRQVRDVTLPAPDAERAHDEKGLPA